MNKEKIYLNLGIIAFQFGACMIHWGLGLMVLGGFLILGAFIEYDNNHPDEEEDEV